MRPLTVVKRAANFNRGSWQQCHHLCRRDLATAASPQKGEARPRTIFSGIQPTGIAHLGNYLGAIQPWVRLQNESQASDKLFFSVVDLHSLTSRSQSPVERRLAKRQTFALLLAAGLDPDRCTIFHQSAVPEHAELYWILGCEASTGWLSRMPTWREKLLVEMGAGADEINFDSNSPPQPTSVANDNQERLKLGLFSYPVLQAADILLYHATHVPVGADQLVHIEFARDAATTFNAKYGAGGSIDPVTGRKMKGRQILTPPQPVVGEAKRVMSLTEEGKKMSKSSPNEKSRILLDDADDVVRKKFKGALTDSFDQQGEGISYDPERRPGVSNLLDIISHIAEAEGKPVSPDEVAKDLTSLQVKGSLLRLLKEQAAEVVIEHIGPLRGRYQALMGDNDGKHVDEIAEKGRIRAAAVARTTLNQVREVIGL